MAQKLKEDLKEKIEQAALDIMLEKGIENCNMRSIAQKAGCTTGNLYRYFENKDRLIVSIIQPLMMKLNQLISDETEGTVRLMGYDFQLPEVEKGQKPSEYFTSAISDRMYNVLIKLGEEGRRHPKRMAILIDANSVNVKLIEWAIELFKTLFYACFEVKEEYRRQVDMLARVFTVSFCEGMIQLMREMDSLTQREYRQMTQTVIEMNLGGISSMIDKKTEEKIIIPKVEVFGCGY